MTADMESGADMASDVAIDVTNNVAGDISSTAHEWMGGPIQNGALSWA